ncbi:hypothetical protein [Citrobacter braakii]|uniref:hypothetical protein n=1 Tax=Citrobacter braakii TaxID=57706 RepID=UPI002DBDBF68|nr:hypothetical protein [Citrobacter braakii]MEB8066573.1 hypothetical protein [Citrobacter braakii]
MITEKNNVFYCDCGFSWRRGMSGSHNCEDRLRAKLTDMTVQLANAESKCRELAAELSAVDKIHNEAVFITDDHYEQCPPEVQKTIRSLAVLQIPAYTVFMAEVRASARNDFIDRIEWIIRNECNPEKTEAIINELQNFSDELKLEAAQ